MKNVNWRAGAGIFLVVPAVAILVTFFQNCSTEAPSGGAPASLTSPSVSGGGGSSPRIVAADKSVPEGTLSTISVSLENARAQDHVILWDLVKSDNSLADADFTLTSGYVNVLAGVNSLSIEIDSKDDGLYNIPNKQYILKLREASNALQAANIAVTVVQKVFSGSISTASNSSCGTINGILKCWGSNANGQFGNGTTSGSNAPIAITTLPANSSVKKVVLGSSNFSCVLLSTGAVYCSGVGSSGQMGNGATAGRTTHALVPMLADGVTDITAGGSHVCAIKAGSLYCWGLNANGQLGVGDNANRLAPTLVTALGTDVAQASAGLNFTCAVLKTTGAVKCWGANASGQLGNATTVASSVPVDVSGANAGAKEVAAGSAHACAVIGDAIKCWGANGSGQLGDATVVGKSIATPPMVLGAAGSKVTAVSAGLSYSCAVANGVPYCWGSNSILQVSPTAGNKTQPTVVSAVLGTGFQMISAALEGQQTCAIKPPTAIHCWGEGDSGQLGTGSAPAQAGPSATPINF